MPAPTVATNRQPAGVVRWIGSALLAIITLVSGYVGFAQYVREHRAYGASAPDILYDILQLFVLSPNPLQDGGYIPPALQVARFTAPLLTLIAFIETARLLLTDKLRLLRTRRAQGHVVVCGDSSAARALVSRSRRAGRQVVLVRSQPFDRPDLLATDLRAITGDATDPNVLRAAGVPRADVVYAATDDSTVNVSIAVAATRLDRGPNPPVAVYAQIHDPELCVSLQARRLAVAQAPGVRLDFFNVEDLAARVMFRREPFDPRAPTPPRLLIAGGSPFARAVLVEAARRWRLCGGLRSGPLLVDYVADDAHAELAVLQGRHPFLGETCEVTPYELPLPVLLAAGLFGDPHDRTFICYPDEEHGVKVALTTHQLWYGGRRFVVVALDRLAGLTAAFHSRADPPVLDEINGSLRLYPLVEAACDPAVIGEDLTERLARLIHEHYLAGCRRRGEPIPAGSLAEWADLDDELRRANRSQAADIGFKLHTIGCVVVPRIGIATAFAFDDDELEWLAEREHQRWKAEQERHGWRLAEQRDDQRRLSPYLVDWRHLAEDLRQKARDSVRDTTDILADAGFTIVRTTTPLRSRPA
jgi:voltage-gated potassium channel Kch